MESRIAELHRLLAVHKTIQKHKNDIMDIRVKLACGMVIKYADTGYGQFQKTKLFGGCLWEIIQRDLTLEHAVYDIYKNSANEDQIIIVLLTQQTYVFRLQRHMNYITNTHCKQCLYSISLLLKYLPFELAFRIGSEHLTNMIDMNYTKMHLHVQNSIEKEYYS